MKVPLRIAVADDEPDMQDYFSRMLPRLGHQVVAVAGDGQQLVEHCRRQRPDLVITDIRMPVLDGIEATRRICEERPVPVVVVSVHHEAQLLERQAASHVLAYLVKPIALANLEMAITVALQQFAQVKELHDAVARQLQGLLCVCAYCKKIRNSGQEWQQMESYLSSHSQARFSHGICPDCYEQQVRPQLAAEGIDDGTG